MTHEDQSQERRRSSDATATALISSSPDINAIFQGLVEKFISMPGKMGAFLAWWLSNIWIVCAFGVTALLASIPFVDKLNEGEEAARQYQLEMFKLQTDIELKKMDRTLLGEGAMTTLKAIESKVDAAAEQNMKIQLVVQKLSGDFEEMQKAQAKTDRKVGSMQAQIRQQRPPE